MAMAEEVKEATDERRDIPAVQESMKRLTQYINASDSEIRRLTLSEQHSRGRIEMLTASLNGAERQLLEAREEVRRLNQREKENQAQIRELTSRAERGDEALRRRAEDAEQRAATYGEQNEELTEKARLGEELSAAGQKLVNAVERLPTKLEDATMIPAAPRQEIQLYETYEWQAVADAKFAIERALAGLPGEASAAS